MATTKIQDLTNIGTITTGDLIVGERVAGTSGSLKFAIDITLDAAPVLGANLSAGGFNIEGVTPTEMSYLSGITSAVQTQIDAKGSLDNVVEDTTPQLGGNLDVNGNEITSIGGTDIDIHSDNDVNVILGDAAGVDDFNIKDSAGSIVAAVTSDGALTAVSYGGITEANLLDKSAAETITGDWDFGGASSLEIPNSATPTVDADGEIALDTTVADFSAGVIKYYGGEEMCVVAMPTAAFTSPTGGDVISYNSTNDEFELITLGGGSGDMILASTQTNTGTKTFNSGTLVYAGATSGTTTVNATAVAGTTTLTLPAATDTLVGKATTDTFTNKTFDANGTGNSLSNVDVADLANGTDGELITWDAAGAPATVSVGTATHVLTSNGTGTAPTFQVVPEPTYGSFAVTSSAGQSVATATFTKVQFNTEDYDTEGDFDPTTNYRHTPSTEGTYLYNCHICYNTAVDAKVTGVYVYKNGTRIKGSVANTSGTSFGCAGIVTPVDMNGTTDYVEFFTYHTYGSNHSLTTDTILVTAGGVRVSD